MMDRFLAVVNLGVPAGVRPAQVKHIQATNLAAIAGALCIGTWAPMAAAAGEWLNATENALACLVFCSVLLVNRAGHHTRATVMLMCGVHFQLLWAIGLFGYASGSTLFYSLTVLAPYLGFDRAHRWLAHTWAGAVMVPWVGATVFQHHLPQRMVLMPIEANAAINTAMVVGGLMLIAGGFLHVVDRALDAVEAERRRADALLLNVLPPVIAERLKTSPDEPIADRFEAISVLFADIVGFTPLSTRMTPTETVELLNHVFSAFDSICEHHGVEKIKTIGDGYMVVAGAPAPMPDHALVLTRAAQDMMAWMDTAPEARELELRIGLNSGAAVAAIVGRTRFHWDLWGDSVNTAARMESFGAPGRIHLTRETWELVKDEVPCEARGTIEVKGKGPMETWFVKT